VVRRIQLLRSSLRKAQAQYHLGEKYSKHCEGDSSFRQAGRMHPVHAQDLPLSKDEKTARLYYPRSVLSS
jgi:hypothetical protein